jgi:heme-degrading monooxygenase HmoA
MAKNYKDFQYFANRPDVVKVWDDLEAYHDWCRFELREFNPAEMYRKDSPNYGAYLASKRPRRPYQGNKPRWNNDRNYDNNRRSYN